MPKLRVGKIELKELATVGGRRGRASYNDVIPWTFCTYEYVTKEEGTKSSYPSSSNRDQKTIPSFFNAIREPTHITPNKGNEPSSNVRAEKIIPSYLSRCQKTIPSYFNANLEPTHITPRQSIAPSSNAQVEKATQSNVTAAIQQTSNIIPSSHTKWQPTNLENVFETESVIHKKYQQQANIDFFHWDFVRDW